MADDNQFSVSASIAAPEPECVADLRAALDRYDWWPEQTPLSTTAAVLEAAREVIRVIDAERARIVKTVARRQMIERHIFTRGGTEVTDP